MTDFERIELLTEQLSVLVQLANGGCPCGDSDDDYRRCCGSAESAEEFEAIKTELEGLRKKGE